MKDARDMNRKHRRRKTLVLLNVISADLPEKAARAAVIDISLGGSAFETSQEFSKDEALFMRFILPGERVYTVKARVVRVSRSGGAFTYGAQFERLGFFSRMKLRRVISDISRTRRPH